MSCLGCAGPEPEVQLGTASTTNASLTVEAFEAGDSLPPEWNSRAFADSLAHRLRALPSLNVLVAPVGATRGYALRGDVAVRNGRMVVGVRLFNAGDTTLAWSATFWRSSSSLGNLADDVAGGAAEALGAELARRSLRGQK